MTSSLKKQKNGEHSASNKKMGIHKQKSGPLKPLNSNSLKPLNSSLSNLNTSKTNINKTTANFKASKTSNTVPIKNIKNKIMGTEKTLPEAKTEAS